MVCIPFLFASFCFSFAFLELFGLFCFYSAFVLFFVVTFSFLFCRYLEIFLLFCFYFAIVLFLFLSLFRFLSLLGNFSAFLFLFCYCPVFIFVAFSFFRYLETFLLLQFLFSFLSYRASFIRCTNNAVPTPPAAAMLQMPYLPFLFCNAFNK